MPGAVIAAAIVACVIAAEHPAPSDSFAWSLGPPQILIATLAFAVFILTLATSPPRVFIHPVIRRLGVLSFSCYVLHFLFVAELPHWTNGLIDVSASGWRAIAMAGLLWITVVAATVLCASVTHRLIEQPGIRLARGLTRIGRLHAGRVGLG